MHRMMSASVEHLVARADGRAGSLEIGIRDRRSFARAGLDRQIGTERDELLHRLGRGRDARLAGRGLTDDGDFHPLAT